MESCPACQELDGKHYRLPAHIDLAFMAERGGGVSGLRLMMRSWRCQRCATWMRQHTEYSDNPEFWEAVVQLNPWYENGYHVHGEARRVAASDALEAWYWIEVPRMDTPIKTITLAPVRIESVFRTKFAAVNAALQAGKRHAKSLPAI